MAQSDMHRVLCRVWVYSAIDEVDGFRRWVWIFGCRCFVQSCLNVEGSFCSLIAKFYRDLCIVGYTT